ncbi:hypothetical protein LQG66_13610 [Bradyrhizobium ontarionense]|uniref:Uncharacterized protein n=1 Tax=Bradyrhizobium ontarionense TaxID=2898149 RepID=A0ABY3RK41_9BRAD|nr:hypothetical protein [Bradyrhizobium sp. A19]UFZ07275.1 hypothetical protein LQG66_13610 [Bradyrhizobium sp. A19]
MPVLRHPIQLQRKACPTCGRPLAVREGRDERRDDEGNLICPSCDGPDPLHSPRALRWTRGSLRPPQRPQKT